MRKQKYTIVATFPRWFVVDCFLVVDARRGREAKQEWFLLASAAVDG